MIERRKAVVRQHDRLPTGLVGIRDGNRTVLVGGVLAAGMPQRGGHQLAITFVEHGKDLARGTAACQMTELPLENQCAAALSVADKVDDINSPPLECGKLEVAANSPQWRLVEGMRLLVIGDQAVELDTGAGRLQRVAKVVLRIDFVNLDEQFLDVLDVQIEPYGRVGRVHPLRRIGEIKIDPLLELLVNGRRQHGVPLLGIALTVDDLGLGVQVPQIQIVNQRFVRLVVVLLHKEMGQVAAHQRFIAADGLE